MGEGDMIGFFMQLTVLLALENLSGLIQRTQVHIIILVVAQVHFAHRVLHLLMISCGSVTSMVISIKKKTL